MVVYKEQQKKAYSNYHWMVFVAGMAAKAWNMYTPFVVVRKLMLVAK